MSDAGIAAQLMVTKGRDARGDRLWIARANKRLSRAGLAVMRTVESGRRDLESWTALL